MVVHGTGGAGNWTKLKTYVVLGCFVSAGEFNECLTVRDLLPKARLAREMLGDLPAEL
jgi:hypothetical protein